MSRRELAATAPNVNLLMAVMNYVPSLVIPNTRLRYARRFILLAIARMEGAVGLFMTSKVGMASRICAVRTSLWHYCRQASQVRYRWSTLRPFQTHRRTRPVVKEACCPALLNIKANSTRKAACRHSSRALGSGLAFSTLTTDLENRNFRFLRLAPRPILKATRRTSRPSYLRTQQIVSNIR